MGRKCKICGYRFKSRDEAICPECFTARDDDISCERYSSNEHSHRARSYSSGLRDTSESFVQKELRDERRNSFARENFGARANAGLDLSDFNNRNDQSRFQRDDYNYDFSREYRQIMSNQPQAQPQQQGSAYQRFTSQVQARQNTASQSGFTAAGRSYSSRSNGYTPPRSTQPFNPRTQMPNGAQRKKNSGGAVAVLVFFIMLFIAVAVITAKRDEEERESREYNNYNYYDTTTTTKKTTTTTKKSTVQQTETLKIPDKTEVTSNLGHYNVKLSNVTFEKKDKADIDKILLGSSTIKSTIKEPWELVTIKVNIAPNSGKPLADPTKTEIATVSLQGLENADAHDTLSYSINAPKTQIDVTNGTEATFTLLVSKEAKRIYFNIYFKNLGVTEITKFTINRE